jgi:hypothetical protein
MPAKMVFHADGKETYRCGDYGIHWTVVGWETWCIRKGRRKACLGREMTISQAMAAAQKDADEIQAQER